MPLEVGTTLGPYEVLSAIGAGGMGEVYKARDTKLDRDVALKILPDAFVNDPERLARFQREAKVLASLNHPNIAQIHGLEESGDSPALVLEYVPGPTLQDRIAKGPIPLDEALPIARQIAEALEAAHEQGIIHRDLKPANVKVKTDGTVKVLDFGLAKALQPELSDLDAANSPTMTMTAAATKMGVIMGTAAYMAPEQAAGKTVDRRSDIWAFGVVLFEMLTGKQLFTGESVSHVLASVLKTDPDWMALPPETPSAVRRLLRRCLNKHSTQRQQHIGDARLEIQESDIESAESLSASQMAQESSPKTTPMSVLVAAALIAGTAATTYWVVTSEPSPQLSARFDLAIPAEQPMIFVRDGQVPHIPSTLAASPDGRYIVFVRDGRTTELVLRATGEQSLVAIRGTVGGLVPFFSPDSQWIGFFADERLKKVPVTGGTPITLCDWTDPGGAAWGPDDTIVFAGAEGLMQVAASGGRPQVIAGAEASESDRIIWPEILPDGEHVLFTLGSFPERSVAVQSLGTSERRILVENGHSPRYALGGQLIFMRDETLWAVAFDPRTASLTGEPVELVNDVHSHTGTGQYSIGGDRLLVYAHDSDVAGGDLRAGRDFQLVWVDRHGLTTPVIEDTASYLQPRLSPDDARISVTIGPGAGQGDLWVVDVERGTRARLTLDGRDNRRGVWTPDGTRITFSSRQTGGGDLYLVSSEGGDPELLVADDSRLMPGSWSPDGQTLAYYKLRSGGRDIWTVSLGEEPTPFLETSFNERTPTFSPDGRWLAYVSDESGRDDVYVRPYPSGSTRYLISNGGGTEPVWSRDGRELFYRQQNTMMAVPITAGADLVAGRASPLFEGSFLWDANNATYDVASDGQRFVMLRTEDPLASQTDNEVRLTVVRNWFTELQARVPTGR